MQVASRWGVLFELALYNRSQMSSALYEGREKEFERAFEHEFIPDTYELINVYKLYEDIDSDS